MLKDFKRFLLRGNVVALANALVERSRREPPADPTEKKCPECRSGIPVDATRCAFCTVQL